MKKVSRDRLYREIDKLFLWLIELPDTDQDEDKSLRAIHGQLSRMANLKSTEIAESQPTAKPQELTLAQRILRGQEAMGGQI